MSVITTQWNKTEHLGDIITIYKDGELCGRLRQIGKRAPDADVRLEWLEWQANKRIDHAVQFPMCSLSDITQTVAEAIVSKYNL